MSGRRLVVVLVAVVAGWLGGTVPAATAQPAGTVDERHCATLPEVFRMPTDHGQRALEAFIDTRGWAVQLDPLWKLRHYRFCDHPHGWLAVSYVLTKGGWIVGDWVLVHWCKTKHGDRPAEWCDPNVPSMVEGGLL